jgi:hypothetical protein
MQLNSPCVSFSTRQRICQSGSAVEFGAPVEKTSLPTRSIRPSQAGSVEFGFPIFALSSPCVKCYALFVRKSLPRATREVKPLRSSAEVRRLWEEPTKASGQAASAVGILAARGGEDVN